MFTTGLSLAVLAVMLWQQNRRGRLISPHVFLALMAVAGACCVAVAVSVTLPVLLGRVAVPPDFWIKPQPGGSWGIIVGAAIGLVFDFYLLIGEPMRRARRIRSFWGQTCAQFALVMLAVILEIGGMSAGVIIGQLIGLGLLPLS